MGIALAVAAALLVIIVPSVVVNRNKQQQAAVAYSKDDGNNNNDSNSNSNSNDDDDDDSVYGSNATTFKPAYAHAESKYANLTRVLTLDHLRNKQRIFVVGDVHGCANELGAMVKKLDYGRTEGAMILVGDLISEG